MKKTLSEENYKRFKVGISKLLKVTHMFRKNDTVLNIDDCENNLVNKVLKTIFGSLDINDNANYEVLIR